MRNINDWVLWFFLVSSGLFILFLVFYAVSIFLPFLLLFVLISGLVNLLVFFYKNYKFKKQKEQQIKNKIEIIDVEYEIIDEK